MITKRMIQPFAILVFGIVVPVIILSQAYNEITTLTDNVNYKVTLEDLVDNFSDVKESLYNGNDFSLFSLLYTEHANQKND